MRGLRISFAFLPVACCIFLLVAPVTAQLHRAFVPGKDSAARDYCFGNQRVLQGAIEMYNMDNSEQISVIDEQTLQNPGPLIPKYLRRPLEIHSGCSLTSDGDLTQAGHIICRKHGGHSGFDQIAQEMEDFKNAAQELTSRGARIDGPDADGNTALHLAVKTEKTEIVKYLLTQRADYSLKNSEGNNALDIAIDRQDLQTAHVLYGHGARPGNSDTKISDHFLLKIEGHSGNVSVFKGGVTELSAASDTYTLPLRLKTAATGRISFSTGRDKKYGNIDSASLKNFLGSGVSVELHDESELFVDKPEFDQKVAIVTSQPMRLLNGEIRVSRSYAAEKAGALFISVGRNLKIKCGPGVYKIVYDATSDSGKVVVRSGSAEVISGNPADNSLKITGFYQVKFDNGKPGNPHQADIRKEFN